MRIFPRRSVDISLNEIGSILKRISFRKEHRTKPREIFEKEFAQYIGTKYAIIIPSARIGISIIFDMLDFKQDDEIILSSYNCHVIPLMLKIRGLKPIFVDVEPRTWNIDTSLIEKQITSKTRAIIATHLFGQPCNIEEIVDICKENSLILIEDAAHSCGATYKNIKVGNFGDAACFSFGTGKALVAFGGGMLTTNNEHIYEKVKGVLTNMKYNQSGLGTFLKTVAEVLCSNRIIFPIFMYPIILIMNIVGSDLIDRMIEDKYVLEEGSINEATYFSELQSTLGLMQLKRLDGLNRKRFNHGQLLTFLLNDVEQVKLSSLKKDRKDIALYYCIAAEKAEKLRRYLALRGVDTKRGTMRACSSLNFFDNKVKCPIAESISNNIIELPCYPSLAESDIYYQANLIRKFYGKKVVS